MLKDLIFKNIIPKKRIVTPRQYARDVFPYKFRGEVEIEAYKHFGEGVKKLIYHDKGPNVVTQWGKHVVMHLLTGEVFCEWGETRSKVAGSHGLSGDTYFNTDGTLISGQQYFAGDSVNWWSEDNTGSSLIYSYFPTKMLFGTGKEGDSWGSFTATEQSYYAGLTPAWGQVNFDDNVDDAGNIYSNIYSSGLLKRKSINEMTSETKTTPVITDADFGISGAIKDGLYENDSLTSKIDTSTGKEHLTKNWSGVGRPCFIYSRRTARFYASGTEVALSWDDQVENKITFTMTMPEQTGAFADDFYPYNGHILKVVGLFADARFILANTVPGSIGESDDTGQLEFENYSKMRYGTLFAKRYIAPITKSHDVSITARWTIYL